MGADTITAFERFLQWGPIGLAGLMLVLVIFTLVTTTVSTKKAWLLGLFMVVGAGCFLAALLLDNKGEHRLVLSVLPNDLDGYDFPPPRILANGQELDRGDAVMITEATALSIDVSRALGEFIQTDEAADAAEARASAAMAQEQEAQEALAAVQADVAASQRELERTNALLAQARLEVQEQEAKLKEAEDTIVIQSAALQEAATSTTALVSEIQLLRTEIESAPVNQRQPVIERQLLELQENARNLGVNIGTTINRQ